MTRQEQELNREKAIATYREYKELCIRTRNTHLCYGFESAKPMYKKVLELEATIRSLGYKIVTAGFGSELRKMSYQQLAKLN